VAYVCRDCIRFRNASGKLRNVRHVALAKLAAQDLPINHQGSQGVVTDTLALTASK
jgi:hypothetical protein